MARGMCGHCGFVADYAGTENFGHLKAGANHRLVPSPDRCHPARHRIIIQVSVADISRCWKAASVQVWIDILTGAHQSEFKRSDRCGNFKRNW